MMISRLLLSFVLVFFLSVLPQYASGQQDLPEVLQGLNLDHLSSEQYDRRLAVWTRSPSSGHSGQDRGEEYHTYGQNFVAQDENLYFIVRVLQKDAEENAQNSSWSNRQSLPVSIYKTRFPDSRSKTGWSQATTELIATFPSFTSCTLLGSDPAGRVYFSATREVIPQIAVSGVLGWDLEVDSTKAIDEEGIFVIDQSMVRQLPLPELFTRNVSTDNFPSRYVINRYPPNDQSVEDTYYRLEGGRGRRFMPERNVAPLVCVNVGSDGLFLTRNKVSSDERRWMDVVKFDFATQQFGEVVTIDTTVNWQRIVTPVRVSEKEIVCIIFPAQERRPRYTLHFRPGEKSSLSKMERCEWCFFDESHEHFFFLKSVDTPESESDPFHFTKVRTSDNEVVEELEFENKHVARNICELSGRKNHERQKTMSQKFSRTVEWDLIVDHGNLFVITRRSSSSEQVVAQASLKDPGEMHEIKFDWKFSSGRPFTYCSTRFVYYLRDDWIIRMPHRGVQEISEPSRFGK